MNIDEDRKDGTSESGGSHGEGQDGTSVCLLALNTAASKRQGHQEPPWGNSLCRDGKWGTDAGWTQSQRLYAWGASRDAMPRAGEKV